MNVRNCKTCGRIFNYMMGPVICPACKDSMEAKFQEVKEYIREHKGANIPEVAEACDVEASQIRQWLRDERLEVTEDSALYLTCESCGAAIRSGRFCEKCKGNLNKDLKDMINANKPKATLVQNNKKDDSGAKMRFLK